MSSDKQPCAHILYPTCGCQPVHCEACETPQWWTPSGLTCENGHGGAPSIPVGALAALGDTLRVNDAAALTEPPKKERKPRGPNKKKSAALHSAATPRWGTPGKKPDSIVERCRRAMGGIDFDPCSEAKFNEAVGATEYFSLLERGEDALVLPWRGRRRLVNPPGGWIVEFWERMLNQSQNDIQSIWIGFSLEQLGQLADQEHHPSDFCICYPRKRIKFERYDGFSGSPSHSNFICGINVHPAAFHREFSSLGRVQFGRSVIGHEFVDALLAGRALVGV